MNLLIAILSILSSGSPNPGIAYSTNPAEKILVLRVNESGFVSDGLTTIGSDELANYVRERLFKTYMSTGKMYDRIQLEKTGEPPELALGVLIKEIKLGQKEALNELCLHKYKRLFEDLGSKQKEKIMKVFPVLFQSTYLSQ